MRSPILIATLALVPCGCVTLTPEEQEYLDHAKVFPTTFSVPKEQADEAWGRAHSFIARFSTMKIQVATDYVIETYNPTGYLPVS